MILLLLAEAGSGESYLQSFIAGSPVAGVLAFFLHKGYGLLERHLSDMRNEIAGLHEAINNNSRTQIAQMFASRGLFEDAKVLAEQIARAIDKDEQSRTPGK